MAKLGGAVSLTVDPRIRVLEQVGEMTESRPSLGHLLERRMVRIRP